MRFVIEGDTISIVGLSELGAENCQSFRDRVYASVPTHCRNIVVDLSGTDYVDSCGLAALISLRKLASSREGKVRLLNPVPRVQLLFDVTRMHRLFEIVAPAEPAASGAGSAAALDAAKTNLMANGEA